MENVIDLSHIHGINYVVKSLCFQQPESTVWTKLTRNITYSMKTIVFGSDQLGFLQIIVFVVSFMALQGFQVSLRICVAEAEKVSGKNLH